MANDYHKIESINDMHKAYGLAKPKNPLINIMDMKDYVAKKEWIGLKFTSSLYYISLKDGSCGLEYGRNTYDFEDGVMSFMSPNQVFTVTKMPEKPMDGFTIYFHPKLIENTVLEEKIDNYNFFSYEVHEALHLSQQEQNTVKECVNMIANEINERIDRHSNKVIVSGLDFLLSLCNRFYERQFNTRTSENKSTLSKIEALLKDYYISENAIQMGLPSVSFLAKKVNLSPGYLSDLLKIETGKTAKEHISLHLIKRAKNLLLGSQQSVSEIAYDLGFEYPQHFSKMFKSKTGMTPKEYRVLN